VVSTEVDRTGRPVERVSVTIEAGYPPEIQKLAKAVESACETGSATEQYEAFFNLAARLLTHAHAISLPTACELLRVSEDELPRLVRQVMGVVMGPGHTTEE
jgi:hypothetical protein